MYAETANVVSGLQSTLAAMDAVAWVESSLGYTGRPLVGSVLGGPEGVKAR